MQRVYNFSPGPACLPVDVLEKAASELACYGDAGMSVMEMSHRSRDFEAIMNQAEADLRELMDIPQNYKVLFLQGGASMQFAMAPLNLMAAHRRAHFVNTGLWSKKAIAEAKRFGTANVVASSEDKTFSYIPKLSPEMFDSDADYAYITYNNTIYGTRFSSVPDVNGLDIVSDMSSFILSEPVDVSKFGLIFAGAQKNIGPAGVTIVIIREDLVGREMDITPTMLKYSTHCDNGSMFNTPPTYAIYIAGLVFKHLKSLGGVAEMARLNREKAGLLYDYLDNSKMFKSTVAPADRSLMNVPFVTGDAAIDARFIDEAGKAGFKNLKGHRTVGGMRASIYNAFPIEGVRALIDFMSGFEKRA